MARLRFASAVGSRRWIVSLAALTGTVALSIDMSLPAQPTLARHFEVSDETAQLSLSMFLIGFALAQIVVGYLSDAWGRRPVLLAGLALFTAAGAACAVSPSIELLLAMRVVQGAGAAAAPVVARAMVRDTQPAQSAARLLSTMLAALAVAPMIAPLIGGALLRAIGWRAIFAALALCGAAMLAMAHATLVETLPFERRANASPRGLLRNYRAFFATPSVRLPMVITCTAFAGQFAYIAVSPFVLIEGYGVSSSAFGLYFGATALALMLGSLFGAHLLRGCRTPGALVVAGASLLLAGGALVVAGTHIDGLGILGFLAPMFVYFFGIGLASPNATALVLAPVPKIAGTASAALGFLTMTSGAIAGYVSARLGGSSPTVFALITLAMATIAAAVAWALALLHRRERERHHREHGEPCLDAINAAPQPRASRGPRAAR